MMSIDANVKKKVINLLSEVTGEENLAEHVEGATDIIVDIGLDSIQMINFVLTIEDEFGIEIDFEQFDFAKFSSIDALTEYITGSLQCIEAS